MPPAAIADAVLAYRGDNSPNPSGLFLLPMRTLEPWLATVELLGLPGLRRRQPVLWTKVASVIHVPGIGASGRGAVLSTQPRRSGYCDRRRRRARRAEQAVMESLH